MKKKATVTLRCPICHHQWEMDRVEYVARPMLLGSKRLVGCPRCTARGHGNVEHKKSGA